MFRIHASFQYCGDDDRLERDIVKLARFCGADDDDIRYSLEWVADFPHRPSAPMNGQGQNSTMLNVTVTW